MLRVSIAALAVLTALVGPAGAARPTDPLAATLDYESIDLPAAWDLETGSPDVVIAVVDSGVDAAHPDLAGALVPGHNFLNESDDTTDPSATARRSRASSRPAQTTGSALPESAGTAGSWRCAYCARKASP